MFKWAAVLLAFLPSLAFAQPVVTHPAPMPTVGQGIMTAGASSLPIAAANVVLAPGSVAFPAANAPLPSRDQLFIANQGAAAVNICLHGGTATATNCYLLGAGASRTFELPDFAKVPPSVIATSGTVALDLEW